MTNRLFTVREALERLVNAVGDAGRALEASTRVSSDEVPDGHAVGGRVSADYTEALAVYPGLESRVDAVRWLGMTTHEQLANALSAAAYADDVRRSVCSMDGIEDLITARDEMQAIVGRSNRLVALLRQWCDSVDDPDCLPTVRQVDLRRATEAEIGPP